MNREINKSKKLIDSARSNMAEVFQEAMLLECVNFTWLTKIEKPWKKVKSCLKEMLMVMEKW